MDLDTLFVTQLHETARVHCFVGASMNSAGAQIPGPAPWAGPATLDISEIPLKINSNPILLLTDANISSNLLQKMGADKS